MPKKKTSIFNVENNEVSKLNSPKGSPGLLFGDRLLHDFTSNELGSLVKDSSAQLIRTWVLKDPAKSPSIPDPKMTTLLHTPTEARNAPRGCSDPG